MVRVHTRLAVNGRAHDKIIKQRDTLDALEQKFTWMDVLARTAAGTLSGKAKIDLETYVQATYFDHILSRANLRLQKMSGGQYDLKRRRNADNKQRRSGLDLDIVDHINATERSVNTLSGGEAQRIKLATELSKRSTGRTIYVLDEPTTGLHVADVARLIDILNRLTDAGNTVLVIEHNLHVIKVADHIIDLGPEGGDAGGSIVFTGTPEDCARCAESYTGQFLKKELEG